MIPQDDLVPLYNVADLFVLISKKDVLEGEGLPLSLIEALACGVPILAGNQDGSIEAIGENINGFAVDPNNREDVLERAKDIIYCGKFGDKKIIREYCERNFSFDLFRRKFIGVVSEN